MRFVMGNSSSGSIELGARILDHFRPAPEFAFAIGGELRGRASDALRAKSRQALLHVGALEPLRDLARHPAYDLLRRFRRRPDAVPRRDVETGKPGLRDR